MGSWQGSCKVEHKPTGTCKLTTNATSGQCRYVAPDVPLIEISVDRAGLFFAGVLYDGPGVQVTCEMRDKKWREDCFGQHNEVGWTSACDPNKECQDQMTLVRNELLSQGGYPCSVQGNECISSGAGAGGGGMLLCIIGG